MFTILTFALILTGEAASRGGEEAGAAEGLGAAAQLPVLAYPAIAAGVFIFLLALTYAFRSVSKRH